MTEEWSRTFLDMINKFFQFRRTSYSPNMHNSEFHILSTVYHEKDGLALSQIAGRLDVSLAWVSRAVSSLVDQGLLKKMPDPTDKRTSLVSLTDQGLRTYSQVKDEVNAFIIEVLSKYDEDEIEAFLFLGTRLADDFLQSAPNYEGK